MNQDKNERDPLSDMREDIEGSLGEGKLLKVEEQSSPEVTRLSQLADELRGIADNLDIEISTKTDEPLEKLIEQTRVELEAAERHKERKEEEATDEREGGMLLTSEMLKKEEDRLKKAIENLGKIGADLEEKEK